MFFGGSKSSAAGRRAELVEEVTENVLKALAERNIEDIVRLPVAQLANDRTEASAKDSQLSRAFYVAAADCSASTSSLNQILLDAQNRVESKLAAIEGKCNQAHAFLEETMAHETARIKEEQGKIASLCIELNQAISLLRAQKALLRLGLNVSKKMSREEVPVDDQGIVKLDVGGYSYTTTLQTLLSVPDTKFTAMFSDKQEDLRHVDGKIFIDRDGEIFRYVLNFLRYAAADDSKLPQVSVPAELREIIDKEFDYFRIPRTLAEGPVDEGTVDEILNDASVLFNIVDPY